jgi:ADP-ribosylglycohydrolase
MDADALRQQRLERATLALAGLAVGDALGGFFEFAGGNARWRIAERWLPGGVWHWTDDTQMARESGKLKSEN